MTKVGYELVEAMRRVRHNVLVGLKLDPVDGIWQKLERETRLFENLRTPEERARIPFAEGDDGSVQGSSGEAE